MTKYRFWQAPFFALFSKDFYRSVGKHWKGAAFTYLLLLLAIAWIPTVLKMNKAIDKFDKEFLADIVDKMPEMEINDGKLITSVAMPYVMDFKDGEPFVIIDTNATVADYNKYDRPILITKNEIIVQKSRNDTRIIGFDQMPDFYLDGVAVDKFSKKTLSITKLLLYPILVINSFSSRIFQALILAIVGLIFASSLNTDIGYGTLVRLSVVAMTGIIILRTVVYYLGINIPYFWLLGIAMTFVYLFIAVNAYDDDELNTGLSDLEADPY